MGVLASDFVLKSQEPLNQKIHTMTSGLQVFILRMTCFYKIIIMLNLGIRYVEKSI